MTLQNVKYRETKVTAVYSVTKADIENTRSAELHSSSLCLLAYSML